MAIQDTDLLYVQRPSGPDAGGYKTTAGDLLTYEYPGSDFVQSIQGRLEQYVSVKDFGAVGDGVTDDTAAWTKAIESGVEVLYVPPGSYNVDGLPTVTGRNFALIGESSRSTKLNCSNTTGNGFAVSIDEGGQAEYAAIIKGITIFSNRNIQAENALYIISDDPVGEVYKQTIIEDVRIQGPWKNGIILDSVRIAKVHNVNFNGRSDHSEIGIFVKGLCMDSVISNYVAVNALQGVGAAIYVDGDVEGIHLTESTIINCLTGVQANAPDYEPSLFISDTHMNTRKYAIAIDNFGQLNIHDNLFYAYTSTDPTQIVDYSGILIQGGNGQVDSVITDNIFHGFGRDANPSANTNGILWNSGFSGTLNDNLFIGLDRGIAIDGNAGTTVISEGNTFRSVTQPHAVLQGNITSVTTADSEHTIEHEGGVDKTTALNITSQGNTLKMRMKADAGGAVDFPANLQFFANGDEALRIQNNATTLFPKLATFEEGVKLNDGGTSPSVANGLYNSGGSNIVLATNGSTSTTFYADGGVRIGSGAKTNVSLSLTGNTTGNATSTSAVVNELISTSDTAAYLGYAFSGGQTSTTTITAGFSCRSFADHNTGTCATFKGFDVVPECSGYAPRTYGYWSGLDNTAGTYSFYSEGSAPSFLAGDLFLQATNNFPGNGNGNGGAHFETTGNGVTLHLSRTDNASVNLNRNNAGAIQTFRFNGNEVGKVDVADTGRSTAYFGTFNTTSSGTNYLDGNVHFNTRTSNFPGLNNVEGGAVMQSAAEGNSLFLSRTNQSSLYLHRVSDGTVAEFRHNGQSGTVGDITINGIGTNYNETSDYRLKKDFGNIENATERFKSLNPCSYKFTSDEQERVVEGFIAHEVQEIVPQAVTGDKDGEIMQSLDKSKLIPLLTKTLQEALERIEILEEKLNGT